MRVANPFGPGFLKSLNAELDDLSQSGSDRGKDRPEPKPAPRKLLRGEPGSVERMQQVAAMVDDPSLVSEMAYETIGTHLQNVDSAALTSPAE